MEEKGKEWQPAANLRELAALSELKRDIVKVGMGFSLVLLLNVKVSLQGTIDITEALGLD